MITCQAQTAAGAAGEDPIHSDDVRTQYWGGSQGAVSPALPCHGSPPLPCGNQLPYTACRALNAVLLYRVRPPGLLAVWKLEEDVFIEELATVIIITIYRPTRYDVDKTLQHSSDMGVWSYIYTGGYIRGSNGTGTGAGRLQVPLGSVK